MCALQQLCHRSSNFASLSGFPAARALLVSCVMKQRWDCGLRDSVTVGETKGVTAEVEFVCGDFTVLDWSDGE